MLYIGVNLQVLLKLGPNNTYDSGHGGCQVVGVLAFYSDNPSSNPAGYLYFLYEKDKNKLKRCRGWPIFLIKAKTKNNTYDLPQIFCSLMNQ